MSVEPAIGIDERELPDSPMQEFYRDKVVFLTGATGVLGELFVQKLLRCNVKRLYILLRAKNEIPDQQRIADIYSTALFEGLRQIDGAYMQRISIISGDMSSPNLGICAADLALLNVSVDLVIHAAANVRFDCPLAEIVLVNVRGTREILRLAMGFQRLRAFVYVSTAFSHSHRLNHRMEERFYRSPMDPDEIIRLAEWCERQQKLNDSPDTAVTKGEDQRLVLLTEKLIRPWPNTYSFSKAITEELVRRSLPVLPIVIVRPSIVIATCEDPIPGYCTNYFGLNGVLVACGIGIVRIVYGNIKNVANVVCADFVVNGTLAIVWDKLVNNQTKEHPIYIMNSGHSELTWGQVYLSSENAYYQYPWKKSVWRCCTNMTLCPLVQLYSTIVYQVIPGFLFDMGLWIRGSKDRLMPVYRRLILFMLVIKFFASTQWDFQSNNIQDVYSRMTPFDRKFFPVGAVQLDFPKFSIHYAKGLRKYICREGIDTLPAAKRKLMLHRIMHMVVLFVYYMLIAGFWYALANRLGVWPL